MKNTTKQAIVRWLILSSIVILFVAAFTGLNHLVYPPCDLTRDGMFYGYRDGSVKQCVCRRVADGWRCATVER